MLLSIGYLIIYCLGEALTAFVDVRLGAVVLVGIVLVTLISVLRNIKTEYVAVGVGLLALQRVLSLTLPTDRMQDFTWYTVVGLPILVAVLLANRAYFGRWLPGNILGKLSLTSNLLVSLLGVPLALVGFTLYRPPVLQSAATPTGFLLDAIAIVLFTGILQELLFRGFLQTAATSLFGRLSIVFVSIGFAASTLGTYSLAFVLTILIMSVLFSVLYDRYRALGGLLFAQSTFALLFILVLPAIFH